MKRQVLNENAFGFLLLPQIMTTSKYSLVKFSTIVMLIILLASEVSLGFDSSIYTILKYLKHNRIESSITFLLPKQEAIIPMIGTLGLQVAFYPMNNYSETFAQDYGYGNHLVVCDWQTFIQFAHTWNIQFLKIFIIDLQAQYSPACSSNFESRLHHKYGINYYIFILNPFDTHSSLVDLTEIYWIKTKLICNSISVNLTNFDGLLTELLRVSERRQNFQGVSISGIGFEPKEFETGLQVHKLANGKIEFLSGFNVDTYEYLSDSLNFTQDHILGTDYASLAENGTILGVGGQVINGEGDISVLSSEMIEYRVKALQFLHPVEEERLFAIYRQLPMNIREIFLEPFSTKLWIGLIILWITIMICLIFIHLVLHAKLLDIGENILWTIGTVSLQGYYKFPSSQALKIGIFVGTISSCIIYYYYSAALVSILSLHLPPIQTFQDLLNYRLRIYGENHTLCVKDLLKHFKSTGQNVATKNSEISIGEAVNYIESSRSAFIGPIYAIDMPLLANNYSEDFICNTLSRVEVQLGSNTKSGMFISKNSPFKDILNYKILHYIETGIRLRLFKKYRTSSIHISCLNIGKLISEKSPVQILDIVSGLSIVGIGIILGCTLLAMELMTSFKWNCE